MNRVRERLIDCFTAVFPGLLAEDAPAATVDSLAVWDSSNHFLLMQVVEEAFAITISDEVAAGFESFDEFENYLLTQVPLPTNR